MIPDEAGPCRTRIFRITFRTVTRWRSPIPCEAAMLECLFSAAVFLADPWSPEAPAISISRTFVRRRLRFVDAIQSPTAPHYRRRPRVPSPCRLPCFRSSPCRRPFSSASAADSVPPAVYEPCAGATGRPQRLRPSAVYRIAAPDPVSAPFPGPVFPVAYITDGARRPGRSSIFRSWLPSHAPAADRPRDQMPFRPFHNELGLRVPTSRSAGLLERMAQVRSSS